MNNSQKSTSARNIRLALALVDQSDLLDQFRAASEHPIGDEPEVPAVVPQALGPLLLAVGIAARGHVVGLAGEKLLRRFIHNLFFVVGENPDNGQPQGSSAQVLDHRAQLTAARITKLIVCLEDQIPNDAHRSDHTRASLYRLFRGNPPLDSKV